ncbi:hypothetical protein P171DRAFT_91687 [Karstenula rhodostoma CBS 690.94]|uniref:FAD linked oxidase N-terminal domain-containing protein n=1 Tax=Karstenula rhodostoma CBS 690.94 TaxID=1392251 RepID=A0A9P4PC33_9PLEO|nr:hypothetical protein P171DRAFT_91687 [Karstenula rhodostoma CBS 690.94]
MNGRLLQPTPAGSPCYEATYNAEACKAAASKVGDFQFRVSQPGGVMYTNFELGNRTDNPGCPLPELPKDGSAPSPIAGACTLGDTASYVVNVTNADDVSKAVKFAAEHNLRLRIKNSGHDYTGRKLIYSNGNGGYTTKNQKQIPGHDLLRCRSFSCPAIHVDATSNSCPLAVSSISDTVCTEASS